MAETKIRLKLLVDGKANKVLFAEAGKEFVDFLFNILSLPVGTVVRLLNESGPMAGSIGSLYKSVESLSSEYFQANVNKDDVLKPKAAVNVPLLKLNKSVEWPDGIIRPGFGPKITEPFTFALPKNNFRPFSFAPSETAVNIGTTSNATGGYVKGVVTYMVMDNLEVKPMSTISGITLMNQFNVKDVSALVERQVQVGFTEGLAILKACFEVTDSVLTTVFLIKKEM